MLYEVITDEAAFVVALPVYFNCVHRDYFTIFTVKFQCIYFINSRA